MNRPRGKLLPRAAFVILVGSVVAYAMWVRFGDAQPPLSTSETQPDANAGIIQPVPAPLENSRWADHTTNVASERLPDNRMQHSSPVSVRRSDVRNPKKSNVPRA
jgi:hypothetical protein